VASVIARWWSQTVVVLVASAVAVSLGACGSAKVGGLGTKTPPAECTLPAKVDPTTLKLGVVLSPIKHVLILTYGSRLRSEAVSQQISDHLIQNAAARPLFKKLVISPADAYLVVSFPSSKDLHDHGCQTLAEIERLSVPLAKAMADEPD
jgi:hypothetical protein